MRFPRHLSQHPGGFVIARGKLSRLVPIENAAMAERSVIQWDKDDLDALGLLKVDILALGMLSMIRRALELIVASSAANVSSAGHSGGRPGHLRNDLPRRYGRRVPDRKPRADEHAAAPAAANLLRPGDRSGDRAPGTDPGRHGASLSAAPAGTGSQWRIRARQFEQALERTLGVPIFQEQVMQIAMLAAGFSAGEADQLRRAMAAWKRKGGLGQFQDKLVTGHARATATTGNSPTHLPARSRALPNTASRKAMRPASRCWPMPALAQVP